MPVTSWHQEDTGVHSEPWLFRALRDLKTDIGHVVSKQGEQGEDIAEIRGKVDTLASFVPRAKSVSSSGAVVNTLLADKLDSDKVARRWWLAFGKSAVRVIAGVALAIAGAIIHSWAS